MTLATPSTARFTASATTRGIQLCADFWGCDPEALCNEVLLRGLAESAARASGATVCETASVAFQPRAPLTIAGVTVTVILAESHLSLHTYPEDAYLAFDIFTCGSTCDPERAYAYLKERLQPMRDRVTIVQRGVPPEG